MSNYYYYYYYYYYLKTTSTAYDNIFIIKNTSQQPDGSAKHGNAPYTRPLKPLQPKIFGESM